jgi:hypothetical protein
MTDRKMSMKGDALKYLNKKTIGEGGQISTLDIFDQTSWNESIWERL